MNRQLSTISNIADHKYVGYYWLSNESKPRLFTSVNDLKPFEIDGKPTNPFILEAALYSPDDNISVSIRHNDSKYLINEVNLTDYSNEQIVELSYLAHKALECEKVNYTELWIPETDDNCEGMEVLTKKATVFTGFDKEV